ncbi:MAG: shikimate dehydrogenase family protein, partial [Acidimicrobiales bacterium]
MEPGEQSARRSPWWPTAASPVVGVIGDPVGHSMSPLLHSAAFEAMGLDWVSLGFRVPGGQAAAALAGARALGMMGLSVTMPHKADAFAAVDECSSVARRLRSVNCVNVRHGRLMGDCTDGEGFVASLRRGPGFDPAGRRCLVIGAG